MDTNDTIAAIATPLGQGGIGIIRISGPDALKSIVPLFSSASFNADNPASHHLYHGSIIDPADNSTIDEVLLSYMKGPSSYTGEDTVEINCHGGIVLLQKILSLVQAQGVQAAGPGDFTKRAFLNGRLDLSRAEAVIDVIEARSEAGLKLASRQLGGDLSRRVCEIRQAVIDITALIEASIDFPEDETEILDHDALRKNTAEIQSELRSIIETYRQGSLYRMGIHAVICGKPNAGKSSLLNALVGNRRSIVTSVPGTTRDIVDETVTLQGIPVTFHDTAGVHHTEDEIERIGIDLTMERIQDADIVLLVLDGSTALDTHDKHLIDMVGKKSVIPVINKIDLAHILSLTDITPYFQENTVFQVSATQNRGIDQLKKGIVQAVAGDTTTSPSDIIITNARHLKALESTLKHVQLVHEALGRNIAPDLIAVDLQAALHSLGDITGETTAEDILDTIFSKFCIGK